MSSNTKSNRRVSSQSSIEEEAIPFLFPEEDQQLSNHTSGNNRHSIQDYFYIAASALMLISSLVLTAISFKYPTEAQCISQMSTWSPMLEAVELEWRHFRTEAPNPYYGKPTDELERNWDRLWQYGSMGIPDSKLHLLNKSLDFDWQYLPDELGGGVTAFFETFHQIHCVHLLRQYSYRDEYDYSDNPAFLRQPKVFYDHIDHCVEVLRVNIMCTADTTPYLIEVRNNGKETVRTDALYHCRNFESIVEWANENIVRPYNVTEERINTIEEVRIQSLGGLGG